MTRGQIDQMLRKIDDVIGPPECETLEDRRRRLNAAARRRELRQGRARSRSGTRAV
jgi:hypothetical protein